MSLTLKTQRLTTTAKLPTKAHDDDAGYDLYADLRHDDGESSKATYQFIPAHQNRMIPTGIAVSIPAGHVGMVCPRSGMAAKDGVTVLNAPGIIDAGYAGEIIVNLYNSKGSAKGVYAVKDQAKIAQLVIVPIADTAIIEVSELDNSERGTSGHGSTGE